MAERISEHGLQVAPALHAFITTEALPGTGVEPQTFWQGFAALAHALMPQNRALLAERERLQAAIDAWHKAHAGRPIDTPAYTAFLQQIGYLVPEGRAWASSHRVK